MTDDAELDKIAPWDGKLRFTNVELDITPRDIECDLRPKQIELDIRLLTWSDPTPCAGWKTQQKPLKPGKDEFEAWGIEEEK
jgi:hypothetical protein